MPLLDLSPRLFRAARRPLAAALAAAVTAAAGCGGSDDPADVAVAGTYELVAYNGNALPYTLGADARTQADVTGGGLDLRADRTFEVTLDIEETDLSARTVEAYTDTVSGSYTTRGNVVTFANTTNAALDRAQATVNGTTLTLGRLTFSR